MAVGTPPTSEYEVDVDLADELDESATTIDDDQKGNTVAAFLQEYVHGTTPAPVFFAELNTQALHHIGADLAGKGLVTPEELGVYFPGDKIDSQHIGADIRRSGNPDTVAAAVRRLIEQFFPHS